MAVDEALFASAAEAGSTTLRFYRWNEPTLSLGYFQAYADRHRHAASRDCAVVRRSTGGGAILHDRELTYSFTAPLDDRFSRSATDLYELLHGTLIETLAELGVDARLCGHPPGADDKPQPFLCFQRRAEFDVLVGDVKIAGSAQRRRHGAVLQHGSLLLSASPAAPELAGLAEISRGVTAENVTPEKVASHWLRWFAGRLETTVQPASLSEGELEAARSIAAAKYGSPHWTKRR
jgi:lipoate-protein ligase A